MKTVEAEQFLVDCQHIFHPVRWGVLGQQCLLRPYVCAIDTLMSSCLSAKRGEQIMPSPSFYCWWLRQNPYSVCLGCCTLLVSLTVDKRNSYFSHLDCLAPWLFTKHFCPNMLYLSWDKFASFCAIEVAYPQVKKDYLQFLTGHAGHIRCTGKFCGHGQALHRCRKKNHSPPPPKSIGWLAGKEGHSPETITLPRPLRGLPL